MTLCTPTLRSWLPAHRGSACLAGGENSPALCTTGLVRIGKRLPSIGGRPIHGGSSVYVPTFDARMISSAFGCPRRRFSRCGEQGVQRQAFRFVFGSPGNEAWTLSLYNAVGGTSYGDPSAVEIDTIREALYLGMHNDVSFLMSVRDTASLYILASCYAPCLMLRRRAGLSLPQGRAGEYTSQHRG